MKIKLNELNKAEWRFIGCEEFKPYDGELILYKLSKKYGYRFNIISYNGSFYITQALYDPTTNIEHISVHPAKSINDAKAVLEVMIQYALGAMLVKFLQLKIHTLILDCHQDSLIY